MMKSWDSLYLASNDAHIVAETLRESLTALGYELYNPFGLLPGKSYPQNVRLFVAPARAGWVRVIGLPDSRQLAQISRLGLCLLASLDGANTTIKVFNDGAEVEPERALVPYLRADRSADDLVKALRTPTLSPLPPQGKAQNIPVDMLPEDIQSLTGGIDMKHAQAMFERLSGNLLGKVAGKDQADAARALLGGGDQPQWNSGGGLLIRSLMACLTIPEQWHEPDFETLRDAYALHERKRRNPNAHQYPGDAEAMNAVPDALDYLPVYAGLKENP